MHVTNTLDFLFPKSVTSAFCNGTEQIQMLIFAYPTIEQCENALSFWHASDDPG